MKSISKIIPFSCIVIFFCTIIFAIIPSIDWEIQEYVLERGIIFLAGGILFWLIINLKSKKVFPKINSNFKISKESVVSTSKKKWAPTVFFILFTIGISIFIYQELLTIGPYIFGDAALFPDQTNAAKQTLSAWHPANFGDKSVSNSKPFIWFLTSVFGNLLAQKIFFLSLIPMSMIFMQISLTKLGINAIPSFIGATLYGFNPVTIGEFTSGSPLLVIYAFLPILTTCFIILIKSNSFSLKHVLFFTIIFSASSSIVPESLIIFAPFILVFFILFVVKVRSKRYLALSVAKIVTIYALTLILLLPSFAFLFEEASGIVTEAPQLLPDVKFMYSPMNAENVLKFAGNDGTGMWKLDYNLYDSGIWWLAFGFVIPLVAFFPLLRRKKVPSLIVIGLSIIALIFIVFFILTREGYTYFLFEEFPLLYAFRNPRKLMFIMVVAMTLLFGFGLRRITFLEWRNLVPKFIKRENKFNIEQNSKLIKHKLKKAIDRSSYEKLLSYGIIIIIVISILTYSWPIFLGDLGITTVHPTFMNTGLVSDYYFEIKKILDDKRKIEGDFRTLWLPMNFNLQLIIQGIDPNTFLYKAGATIRGPLPNYYIDTLSTITKSQTNEIGKGLGLANVKYVILDLKSENNDGPIRIQDRWQTIYAEGTAQSFQNVLDQQNDLVKEIIADDYIIYRNIDYLPSVLIFDHDALDYLNDYSLSSINSMKDYLINDQFNIVEEDFKYKIKGITESEKIVIILSDSFDRGWNLKITDAIVLEHFKAFSWANGYVVELDSDLVEAELEFTYNTNYRILLFISSISWIIIVIMTIVMFVKKIQFSYQNK